MEKLAQLSQVSVHVYSCHPLQHTRGNKFTVHNLKQQNWTIIFGILLMQKNVFTF